MNNLITCGGCQQLSKRRGGITGNPPIDLCEKCWHEIRSLVIIYPNTSALHKFNIMVRKHKLAKLLS